MLHRRRLSQRRRRRPRSSGSGVFRDAAVERSAVQVQRHGRAGRNKQRRVQNRHREIKSICQHERNRRHKAQSRQQHPRDTRAERGVIGPVGVLKIGSLVLLQRLGTIVARVKIQTPAHGKQALIIAHAQKLPALALGDVQIFLHLVVILDPRLAAWN